mmetsp:Transcript_9250/g.24989  ORF Transcript_9250/g.24989 Transcript_9250/m.24989 type:complete len:299 (-) Transcript_9250:93-989(-)
MRLSRVTTRQCSHVDDAVHDLGHSTLPAQNGSQPRCRVGDVRVGWATATDPSEVERCRIRTAAVLLLLLSRKPLIHIGGASNQHTEWRRARFGSVRHNGLQELERQSTSNQVGQCCAIIDDQPVRIISDSLIGIITITIIIVHCGWVYRLILRPSLDVPVDVLHEILCIPLGDVRSIRISGRIVVGRYIMLLRHPFRNLRSQTSDLKRLLRVVVVAGAAGSHCAAATPQVRCCRIASNLAQPRCDLRWRCGAARHPQHALLRAAFRRRFQHLAREGVQQEPTVRIDGVVNDDRSWARR